ncbi:hypothetical protein AA313_de0204326 [Arthrobotrys entomopaga]|nr:hypothetical protein AA313_de0204326 [Arthrobotrys entomopaga]
MNRPKAKNIPLKTASRGSSTIDSQGRTNLKYGVKQADALLHKFKPGLIIAFLLTFRDKTVSRIERMSSKLRNQSFHVGSLRKRLRIADIDDLIRDNNGFLETSLE